MSANPKIEPRQIADASKLGCPFRGGYALCTTTACMAWQTTERGSGYCVLLVPKS